MAQKKIGIRFSSSLKWNYGNEIGNKNVDEDRADLQSLSCDITYKR